MTQTLDTALQRDRALIVLALAVVTGAGWLYLLAGAGMDMPAMGEAADMAAPAWTAKRLLVVSAMWVVMMAAMMLPSAAPMILLHRMVDRKRFSGRGTAFRTGVFAGGYLLTWTGFSIAATAGQWALDQWGLLSSSMAIDGNFLSAALLLTAGVFQLSPLKSACLRHCRSPLSFLARHWRADAAGILVMGMRHGLYCVGCCWALMALLFVGGVMNMLWIVGLTAWVLLEKVAPQGRLLGHAAGIALIVAALAMLAL